MFLSTLLLGQAYQLLPLYYYFFNWKSVNKLFFKKQITGPIRQDGPIDHIIKKSGTPTMGGLMILLE